MPRAEGFYKDILDIELSASDRCVPRIRNIFEMGTLDSVCSTSASLWLRYIQFERDQGNFTKANTVQWRAMQVLKHDAEFNRQLSQLN